MALRKIIEAEGLVIIQTEFGNVENGTQKVQFSAYIKVVSIVGNKSNVQATVNFSGTAQQFIRQYDVPVSVEDGSKNFVAQVYEHLKTLPEFAGATNC
jgi:hypothetical protein